MKGKGIMPSPPTLSSSFLSASHMKRVRKLLHLKEAYEITSQREGLTGYYSLFIIYYFTSEDTRRERSLQDPKGVISVISLVYFM